MLRRRLAAVPRAFMTCLQGICAAAFLPRHNPRPTQLHSQLSRQAYKVPLASISRAWSLRLDACLPR